MTSMLAGAAYAYGRNDIGLKCLSILKDKNLSAQCSSRINEIYRPDGTPEGCPSQTWSIGILPFVIDRYILGIEMDVPGGLIHIRKPTPEIKARRDFVINGEDVKLDFSNGEVTSNRMTMLDREEFIIKTDEVFRKIGTFGPKS